MKIQKIAALGAAIVAAVLAAAWLAHGQPPWSSPAPAAEPPASTAAPVRELPRSQASAEPREAVAPAAASTWILRGRITDQAGAPWPKAQVRAFAARGEVSEEAGTAVSGDDGTYAIDIGALRALSALQRATAVLAIHVTAAGALPGSNTARERLPAGDKPHTIELNKKLFALAGSIVGRVVAPDLQPARAVRVFLRRENPADRPSTGSNSEMTTETDGRFAFRIDEPGLYTLAATAVAHGFVWRDLGALATDLAHDAGDLVLRPLDVIEAQLVMADGTPAAGLRYDVRHLDEEGLRWLHVDHPRPAVVEGQVQPVRWFSGLTDDDGRLRGAVLAPGQYRIRVRNAFASSEHHASGSPQEFVVSTGSGLHRLVLDGQLLTVHVREAPDTPLPGSELRWCAWAAGALPTPEELQRAHDDDAPLHADGQRLRQAGRVDHRSGTRTFLAPFGSFWAFSATLRGAVPVEATWSAEAGVPSADIYLTLRGTAETGRLMLVVVDERGLPVDDYEVAFSLPVTGGPAFRTLRRDELEEGCRTPPLPAGDYRVTVRAGPEQIGVRAHAPRTETAQISAGETTSLRFAVRRGGFMRLVLTGADPAAPSWPGLRVVVEQGVDSWQVDRFAVSTAAEAKRYEGFAPVGAPLFLGAFPAGQVSLTVRAHGFAPVQCVARIEPGETTDVDVAMTPQ